MLQEKITGLYPTLGCWLKVSSGKGLSGVILVQPLKCPSAGPLRILSQKENYGKTERARSLCCERHFGEKNSLLPPPLFLGKEQSNQLGESVGSQHKTQFPKSPQGGRVKSRTRANLGRG